MDTSRADERQIFEKAKADPESENEGHHNKICDQDSDAVLDACFTCDP